MWKFDISLFKRFLHSDVKGRICARKLTRLRSDNFQAFTPVAVLIAGWALKIEKPDYSKLAKVALIVIGIALASFGEIDFVMAGFLYQCAGIFFEAIRICMVQRLLQGDEFKMDPLVSLYYYAPVCALMNLCVALVMEVPHIQMSEIYAVGLGTFLVNAGVAFLLNVSVVFLVSPLFSYCRITILIYCPPQIGKTSGLVLTLCGVLKDILLVLASILIWGTVISGLQTFGYSIAIIGMLYYKLGDKELKPWIAEGSRRWQEFGQNKPITRKLLIIVMVVGTFVMLIGGLGGSGMAGEYVDTSKYLEKAKNVSGW